MVVIQTCIRNGRTPLVLALTGSNSSKAFTLTLHLTTSGSSNGMSLILRRNTSSTKTLQPLLFRIVSHVIEPVTSLRWSQPT